MGTATGTVAATALLPLRAFLGATFLYAGLDKLMDPAFLDTTSPAGIHAQLEGFARTSPIAFLVKAVALPFPNEVGLLIALAEIAIGLGALSGILFRAAAAAGAGVSLLFWLTASWTTHPYYYGPDLPYALGWATLAFAGSGQVLVLGPWLERRVAAIRSPFAPALSEERRTFLQVVFMAGASVLVALVVPPLRAVVFGREAEASVASPRPPASPGSSGPVAAGTTPEASLGPAAAATPPAGTVQIATLAQFSGRTSIDFTIPPTSDAQIPGGDPGVLVKLANGKIVAFDAVCTHAGCTVAYDDQYGLLLCPCHGAAFDPNDAARAVAGPTNQPLQQLPIQVDQSSGAITLHA
jgi:thiosulfate dehydrogenase [quinone] large subunit